MPNFMLLATAWGPKYGGINAFNMDFASGLANYLGENGKVFCSALSPSREDIEDAKDRGIHLLGVARPVDSAAYDKSWALDVWQQFAKDVPDEIIDWWVGHDVTTGWAAIEGPTVGGHGRSAVIMHMNYADYQSYKGGVGERAAEKERGQRRLFAKADRCFANGPLLRDALSDIVANVSMLIPGFADVPIRPSSHRLHVITFGRMDRESDRIKQGGLAVAGFASAIKQAWSHPGSPEKLKDNPQMRIIGISEPGGNEEQLLKRLAAQKADRMVNLIAVRFDENRDQLFDELGRANISLMLSWHEGFGLTGWEALAGEIPLIISRQTGLWQLLKETFGEHPARGYVRAIDVRGQEGDDDIANFRPDDETTVRDAIIECAATLEEARKAATRLKKDLKRELICTWENTAKQFCCGLGIELSKAKLNGDSARTEPTQQPTSRSTFVTIPKLNWPADFDLEIPDSMLLRPEGRVVRFHPQRLPLRDTIIGWALDPDEPIKLRLQAGEGGSGKTRLLIEVCEKLESAHNWRAGFFGKTQSGSSQFLQLLTEEKPILVVLDYAEGRASEIVELVRTAMDSKNISMLRFVLLAREGGDWWDRIDEAAGSDHAVSAILKGINRKTGPYRMAKERIEFDDRDSLFRDALRDFASHKKLPLPAIPTPDLSNDVFGNPLFIHLAALAGVRDRANLDDNELLSTTLGHERSFWRRLLNSFALPEDMLFALEQAVALLTLSNGARSAKSAKELLARTPRLQDLPAAVRTSLFDLLRRIYPSEGGLAGLEPDLLGETLIGEVLARDDELLDVVLGKESNREVRHYALTILTRLARRIPSEERWLKRALERNLIVISEDALNVGIETGSPMPKIHAQVLRSAQRKERRQAVEKLRQKLPEKTLNLVEINIEIRRQSVAFLDEKKSGSPTKRHAALAQAFSGLAFALRDKGLLTEAANAASEAVRQERLVVHSTSASDREQLAGLLVNQANHLKVVGRYDEALKAAEQAEALWRELAEKQPEAHTANWATSLGGLSNSLADVGRFEEGLEAIEQAERLRQMLSKKQPTVDWATTLSSLAVRLSEVGRFEEGLDAAVQSEEFSREFAKRDPDAYTVDWAKSLSNLGNRLRQVGRLEEALDAAKRAETLRRSLAEKQPDAYTADWAASLSIVGNYLGAVGLLTEGLEAAEKAEKLWRGLAKEQPGAYTDYWAGSLSNLGVHLREFQRFEESLEVSLRAEELWRRLAEEQPDANPEAEAAILGNLAESLVAAGRFDEGLHAAKTALEHINPFAERYPRVYGPWLGFAHRVVAEALFKKELIDEAITEARRSANIWSEVAKDRQNYESKQVAKTFRILMECEIALGRNEMAIAALTEAFLLLQRPLEINAKPLQSVMSELIELVQFLGHDSVARAVPNELLAILKVDR